MRVCLKYFFPFIFLFAFLFSSHIFSPHSFAATSSDTNPQAVFYKDVFSWVQEQTGAWNDAEEQQEQFIYSGAVNYGSLNDTFNNLSSMIIPLCVEGECTSGQTAVASITSLMAVLYRNPPASSIAYAQDVFARAGFATPAYAQGIGFAALAPFLPLWRTVRDVSYSLLIIVLIVIGFMIIFRMKIDPKTVISVQAALPRIVLALVLITLSYPIVGFLVDLMYVIMSILISLLVNGVGGTIAGWGTDQLQTEFLTGDLGDLFKAVFSGGFRSFDDFALKFLSLELSGGGIGVATALILGSMTWWIGGVIGTLLPIALFTLILLLGLLFVFIRLLMILVNSYIQLVISLILAPLLLLGEAIPGRSAFRDWILNIMANLSVFPATVIVLLFSTYLTSSGVGGSWTPPLIGIPGDPGGVGQGFFGAFMGLSIIFVSPHLVVSVKKMFQPRPTLPISAGTAFAPVTSTVQTTLGAAGQFHYAAAFLGEARRYLPFLGGGKGDSQH